MYIKINTVQEIYDFIKAASAIAGTVNAISGMYVVNAKSIMGLHSLNLSDKILLAFGDEVTDEEKETLKRFEVSED